jgi:PAS domain-containing protein
MMEPATERDMSELERAYGQAFPDDFQRIHRRFGGGELIGKDDAMLVLEPIADILDHGTDPVLSERLPGAIVIADDGGGKIFFYDAEDRLGRGRFAVFLNSRGLLSYASAVYVGATISEVIEKTLELGELDQD